MNIVLLCKLSQRALALQGRHAATFALNADEGLRRFLLVIFCSFSHENSKTEDFTYSPVGYLGDTSNSEITRERCISGAGMSP